MQLSRGEKGEIKLDPEEEGKGTSNRIREEKWRNAITSGGRRGKSKGNQDTHVMRDLQSAGLPVG